MVTTEHRAPPAPRQAALPQYTPAGIAGIWAAAALPMASLAWLVTPWLADTLDGPAAWPRALVGALTAGLVWQFVLVMALVRREQGSLRWGVLKEALWLRSPVHPRTGRRGGRAWWLVVPLIVAFAIGSELPAPSHPANRDLGVFLGSDAGQTFLSGNWGWFAVIAAMLVFNSVLGEELLFRGLLLPRMQGAFGRWDWAANGVLFAAYHLHVPWAIPATLLDTFILAYPSRRYRSALIGIAVHSAQSVVTLGLVVALVLR
ncbi:MAG: lysostaphin resistance A-like protein [Actinomycetes bacterium]